MPSFVIIKVCNQKDPELMKKYKLKKHLEYGQTWFVFPTYFGDRVY